MKLLMMLVVFALGIQPLRSQIELPDFFVEDEDPFQDENFVPNPERAGGMHARPESETEAAEDETSANPLDDPAARRMIQQINMGNVPRVQRIHMRPEHGLEEVENDQKRIARLLAGPESVSAVSRLGDGSSREFEIPNQTLILDTRAGNLPLRLHELASMKLEDENEAVYRFELLDGDLVSGKLTRPPVVKSGDTLRSLASDELRELTLSQE